MNEARGCDSSSPTLLTRLSSNSTSCRYSLSVCGTNNVRAKGAQASAGLVQIEILHLVAYRSARSSTRSVVMTVAVAFKPRLPIKKDIPSRQRRLKRSPQIPFVVFDTILAEKLQIFLLECLLPMVLTLTLNVSNHLRDV